MDDHHPRGDGTSLLTKLGVGALTCNFFLAAYRSRGDPSSVAFVLIAYAALLLLLHSLRKFERAPPADRAGSRRRSGGSRLCSPSCSRRAWRRSCRRPSASWSGRWPPSRQAVDFGRSSLAIEQRLCPTGVSAVAVRELPKC
ncbi:unnamed protein product [Urochloa humidicola]